ncbi:unnamed protein product [Pseudo-nitzschia multistriata]|uniref:Uncharacterized protein n=1 Tax=Pseudo-nitzschia multistriata TaxID=183589 RepID=A0A448YYC4_9STRA|nr:unnamed protein product [Pseudo-nitzschia multistriata]
MSSMQTHFLGTNEDIPSVLKDSAPNESRTFRGTSRGYRLEPNISTNHSRYHHPSHHRCGSTRKQLRADRRGRSTAIAFLSWIMGNVTVRSVRIFPTQGEKDEPCTAGHVAQKIRVPYAQGYAEVHHGDHANGEPNRFGAPKIGSRQCHWGTQELYPHHQWCHQAQAFGSDHAVQMLCRNRVSRIGVEGREGVGVVRPSLFGIHIFSRSGVEVDPDDQHFECHRGRIDKDILFADGFRCSCSGIGMPRF